jgi:hypothetical protein
MKITMGHAALTVLLVTTARSITLTAWGVEGHAAVASVAASRISSRATTEVAGLLDGATMASVASWADDDGRTTHPETNRWHFVNTPYHADSYDPRRDCQQTERGDCAIAAIPRLEQTLRNKSASSVERRNALMFLIHVVADLHNPMHAIQRDDTAGGRGPGGLDTKVALGDKTFSLHTVWDSGVIQATGTDSAALVSAAGSWLKSRNPQESTDPVVWAAESFRWGKTVAYPQASDGRISESEQIAALAVIEERIALAGARLAEILNRALGEPRS